jgi:hypothetical protein
MTKLREKAQARTMQMVGEMIGDDQLVREGKERQRKAEQESNSSGDHAEPASQNGTPRS